MGVRRLAVVCASALALLLAPAALAGAPLTVGYSSAAALRGLDVLTVVAPLHVARVAGVDAATLRSRPGIRWVHATLPRRHLGSLLAAAPNGAAAAEWEFTATRANLVPASVQHAAARMTIAVVDTGADLSAPDIAAKFPVTY